ncbi:lipid droplet-associated protein [Modestobacter sp. VKM Ac-2985]|uniref:lipid droplet-associated protein n=1 Tax=Modestobacter sp. VKM Ac-2985 TaxID=3004139 RepID=UPI0022ABAAB9|nr:lipid droplet-associated protein [Modestobacter sp. VKM Ac-2985]MCZ2836550.1 lipid droplet-associated protein [Modestobacter sp. VKM Ac-2985]
MAREIPEVVRAAAGLAATVLDEARKLPTTLPGLPVRLIGQALQTSLHLQQQYSGLVARGDEVLTSLRGDAGPGMATFDDDVDEAPTARPARPASAGRGSAFDRVVDLDDDLGDEPPAEELADALADDLAAADLPVADPDDLTEEVAAVLAASADDTVADLTPAEVAALPDDPAADAVTAVVDELAAEVADEVAAEVPDAVPDEVLEELTADTVSDVAEDEAEIEEAVADELVAEPAVPGTPPAEVLAGAVSTLDDVTPEQVPGQTQLVDDAVPDVPALDDAAEELVDLGGPEAAESVAPGSDVTDSAASDPLVPSDGTEPADDGAPVSPVEGYDAFSIPALRGHLRAYPTETVADLLDYERATRARAPYVTLLQNRLEKLSADRG